MSQRSCNWRDDTFGPYAGECRGGFDFTLLFEETILTILPTSLFHVILGPRVWFLLRRPKKAISGHALLRIKLSTWLVLAALRLALLSLWATPTATRTRASLATAALVFVSSLSGAVLSYAEHVHAIRPSSLLGSYLFSTILFDIAHARTLWLRALNNTNHAIASLAVAAVVVKLGLIVLEAFEKRRLLSPQHRSCPPEAAASMYNRYFFWWLNPMFLNGFGRILEIDHLFQLDKKLAAARCHQSFKAAWRAATERKPTSLLMCSFRVLIWPILQTIPARAALIALVFCQPFLINRAITLSQQAITLKSTQTGYGLIGAYFLVYVGIAICMGQYQHLTYRTITMARAGLVSVIYRKTETVGLRDLDPASSVTLMGADMERVVHGWQTMHEIWANAIEVGVAVYLLERQLGIACVVPVAVSLLSLVGSMVAMNSIMSRQALWLEAIERRISATSAMLSNMKGIKMCGLSETLLQSLQKLRVDEMRISKKFRKLLIWNMCFAYITQIFAPVLTFTVFSLHARSNSDTTLDTARVFTALSLFSLLSEPISSLVMSLSTFLGAVGSFSRIQQFLDSAERVDNRKSIELGEKSTAAIETEEADFGWDKPLLRDVTIRVPWQGLTMVIGPVGCGKTTLLNGLLGEIPFNAGKVKIGSTSVAYCSQVPWHMNATIKQAIVGSSDWDEKWYLRVVDACALTRDFNELPLRDESTIGSGGIALSGGQGQRVALARAVYARRQIVMLDDTFSGLDTTTENHVFHRLCGQKGIFREFQTTVLLVSSSAKRLPYSDHIICLDLDGRVTAQGRFDDLNNDGGYVASFNLPKADWVSTVSDASAEDNVLDLARRSGDMITGKIIHHVELGGVTNSGSGSSFTSNDTTYNLETESSKGSRQTGDFQIYLYYIRFVGWWTSLVFIMAIIAFVFCISFPNVWVQWWAADNEKRPNERLGYWLGVYAGLGGIAIACLFISCWQMIITMVPRSGERFHLALLKTVLSAPMSFFVNTDSGVTLNRFSQDLMLVDMELPIAALNTFATFVLCIAQMALIGVGTIYAALSFPIVLLALYLVQKFYLRTSRQLRLMDLEAKAPLYTLFEETLRGLSTIRAFDWQSSLATKNDTLLDRSQRPFYLLFAAQRWLTLVLDLIVAAVAVLLIVLVVQLRGTVAAGGVGLALLNVIQFSQNVKLLVTFWTTLETQIGSVSRIRSFTKTSVSEDQPGEDTSPPLNWPAKGAVDFEKVSAAYSGTDLVLRDISISVAAGEKIAICGRTGSGKTSLIMSLFRIVDTKGGSIRVDGVDISTMPRKEVRRHLVGVPQHAFLLKGSVRLNIDPSGGASDEAIRSALTCVQMMDFVDRNGGLDGDVDNLNLSSGQKQLFCLARAMVRPGRVVVLDEVTSSVDARTEDTVQKLIRRKFAAHTVIAVTHRLDTIMDFDRVVVMDKGRVVEVGKPWELKVMDQSWFGRLWKESEREEE
ncbi:P-loop containing nucleoside triphosphate hydrolase protein [Coniochaeta sp. 2T2.1]|nr:P-loop containing nucleoside triphosphate hydrolase protein [Coniochaeta sp. 2T2.1]